MTFVAGGFFQEAFTRKSFIDVTFAITFGSIAFVTAGTIKDQAITHFCWSIVRKVCGKLLQKKVNKKKNITKKLSWEHMGEFIM